MVGAREGEVLDIRAQRIGHRRVNSISTRTGALAYCIAYVIHDIGIVASTARHGVDTQASIEGIRPRITI